MGAIHAWNVGGWRHVSYDQQHKKHMLYGIRYWCDYYHVMFLMVAVLCRITWKTSYILQNSLHWRHNGHDGVSNHQPHYCLFNSLFRRRSKKTSNLRVTGLCPGNSPRTGEFLAQMGSNAENAFNLTEFRIWYNNHNRDLMVRTYMYILVLKLTILKLLWRNW